MEVLHGRSLAKRIYKILRGGSDIRCAVAFWGPALGEVATKVGAKVVLDISMKGTSRNALAALNAPKNKKVRVLDGLHTKLFINDEEAIIGSANASTRALGADEKAPQLFEAGVCISRSDDTDTYDAACKLFKTYWNKSLEIHTSDIQRATRMPTFDGARDLPVEAASGTSILENVAHSPDRFKQTVFMFGDEIATQSELAEAKEQYEGQFDQDELASQRQLICITYTEADDVAIQGACYIIMYWFGSGAGIFAYYDIVRVPHGNGAVSFFGRKQWSVVRKALNLLSVVKVKGYWEYDRAEASAIAASDGDDTGDRFVILTHDALYERMEERRLAQSKK